MQRAARYGAIAPLAALLAVLSACAGGSDDRSAEDIQADIAAQLEEGGKDEPTAECVAEVVVAEVGVDELSDVDFSDEEPPAELQEDITRAALAAIDECDLGPDGEQ